MKKFLVSLCLLTASIAAMAQIDDDDKQLFNHVGLSAGVGLDGISIEATTTICPYVQMRAGIALFPSIKVKDIGIGLDYQDNIPQEAKPLIPELPKNLLVDAKLNMTNFKMLFDLYPTKTSPWRLTVGFYAGKSALIDIYSTNCKDELREITNYNDKVERGDFKQYGTLPIIGANIDGTLIRPQGDMVTAALKVNGFKPYIGIGSGRAISNKHRFSFAWDLGVQFWGTPKIYLLDKEITTKALNNGDGDIIKTVNSLTIYPTLSFRINGRIL